MTKAREYWQLTKPRVVALIVFCGSLLLLAATFVIGVEIKGARRWIVLAGVNIQPSEFLKPAFVIIVAWLFGESAKRPDMPANTFSLILLLTAIALLVVQPDFGQGTTVLFDAYTDVPWDDPAYEIDPTHPLLLALQESYRDVTGKSLDAARSALSEIEAASGGWSFAKLTPLKVPASE